MTDTEAPNINYGPQELAMKNQILRSTVGSEVHGISIEGTDDHDELGIFVEPIEYVASIKAWDYVHNRPTHSENTGIEHHTFRSVPEGQRSHPGSVDLNMYSLRKFSRLAYKGNPTVLLPLFAPQESVIFVNEEGNMLRDIRQAFLSQHAVHRFFRYMDAQHERMLGRGRQGRVPNRPELVEKHGYDTKYASHALRLAMQGHEVASTGHLTLPMPDLARELVLAIKEGRWAKEDVSKEIRHYERMIQDLLDQEKTPLPVEANWELIDATLVAIHLSVWDRNSTHIQGAS